MQLGPSLAPHSLGIAAPLTRLQLGRYSLGVWGPGCAHTSSRPAHGCLTQLCGCAIVQVAVGHRAVHELVAVAVSRARSPQGRERIGGRQAVSGQRRLNWPTTHLRVQVERTLPQLPAQLGEQSKPWFPACAACWPRAPHAPAKPSSSLRSNVGHQLRAVEPGREARASMWWRLQLLLRLLLVALLAWHACHGRPVGAQVRWLRVGAPSRVWQSCNLLARVCASASSASPGSGQGCASAEPAVSHPSPLHCRATERVPSLPSPRRGQRLLANQTSP